MTATTALVTGASSGIGEATALKLHELGYTVYGAARRTERLQQLASRGIRPLAMDVTDDDSMQRRRRADRRRDRPHRRAGQQRRLRLLRRASRTCRWTRRAASSTSTCSAPIRLTQLVLPHMRAQRSGTIINITSMGGKIHTPLGGWYHGTKFAARGPQRLPAPGGQAVRHRRRRHRAGRHQDRMGRHRRRQASSRPPARAPTPTRPTRWPRRSARKPSAPAGRRRPVVADAIAKAVTARRPKTRYAVGFGAKPLIAPAPTAPRPRVRHRHRPRQRPAPLRPRRHRPHCI